MPINEAMRRVMITATLVAAAPSVVYLQFQAATDGSNKSIIIVGGKKKRGC